jgi:hypothetical protein
MKKIIKFVLSFLLLFSQFALSQFNIQYTDLVSIPPSDEYLCDSHASLNVGKGSFFMIFPQDSDCSDLREFNEMLACLKSDKVSLISNPNGDTLSIHPDDYVNRISFFLDFLFEKIERVIDNLRMNRP